MATYLLVNIGFIVLVLWLFKVKQVMPIKLFVAVLAVLLMMTAIFDSLIVGFGIVSYDTDQIIGVYIGRAPIEDFCYTILAVLLVPSLWNKLGEKHARKD